MSRASFRPPCLAAVKVYQDAEEEFRRIRRDHRTLAPTGCTMEFCQAGRATHLNEPRVGRDRPLGDVQDEASNFLRECYDQGIIASPKELDRRIQDALAQIESSAIQTTVTDVHGQQFEGRAGGVWEQTLEELKYGVKVSWRNARKCIMRSEYDTLRLCDLRHVNTSQEMGVTIIEGVRKAFNNGRIVPTVFLFPPRQPGSRGPMIWNHQILAFAGYQDDDSSSGSATVLGDPASVDITQSMIDFGWTPPFPRSRWDILPLVTMAEGDVPCLTELPPDLKRTIRLMHPQYLEAFRELDLRWVLAPVLSRLGFDIGGNQYTASPFIGWFMDAEIGVRDLADEGRYNVLPEVIQALRLSNDQRMDVEDLPGDERLLALSRAQAELNFAVHYSFRQEGVMMSDSLTCSEKYMTFDERRKKKLGYGLPADPYWLAPPQGSIIPLWHQGAAPNYQPKPMICRHVQNPVKAWNRQAPADQQVALRPSLRGDAVNEKQRQNASLAKVSIVWCSAGASAAKIARRLCHVLKDTARNATTPFQVGRPLPLDAWSLEDAGAEDFILAIVSTHDRGNVPSNGTDFVQKCGASTPSENTPKFAVFGHGDSSYGDTYNAAAAVVHAMLRQAGCVPLLAQYFPGDSSLSNPDWRSFGRWCDLVCQLILDSLCGSDSRPSSISTSDSHGDGGGDGDDVQRLTLNGSTPVDLLADRSSATVLKVRKRNATGIVEVILDVGDVEIQEMDHLRIVSPNLASEVTETLKLLNLRSEDILHWHNTTASDLFRAAVDLEQPFKSLDWYPKFKELSLLKQHDLCHSKVNQVLKHLNGPVTDDMLEHICKDMQSIQPRTYSVASSAVDCRARGVASQLKILVQLNHGGRFSDRWLAQARRGSKLQFTTARADAWGLIKVQNEGAPLILVTTGSGIAPVRAVLQRRVHEVRTNRRRVEGSVSLFIGCKKEDEDLMRTIVLPAQKAGFLKILKIVPSNAEKTRVQDMLLSPEVKEQLDADLKHPHAIVFICANNMAAQGTAANLSAIAGKDIRYMMQDRYTTELFDG